MQLETFGQGGGKMILESLGRGQSLYIYNYYHTSWRRYFTSGMWKYSLQVKYWLYHTLTSVISGLFYI